MNTTINHRVGEVLAEARAIKFAIVHGVLRYSQAKARVKPLLEQVNEVGKLIAKKYGR